MVVVTATTVTTRKVPMIAVRCGCNPVGYSEGLGLCIVCGEQKTPTDCAFGTVRFREIITESKTMERMAVTPGEVAEFRDGRWVIKHDPGDGR